MSTLSDSSDPGSDLIVRVGSINRWEGIVSRVNFGCDEILRNLFWSVSSVLLLIISLIWLQRWNAARDGGKTPEKGLNLPPGPKGWPILGVMLRVAGDQKHSVLWDVSKEYGGIFNMRTGLRDFIAVMKADIAYEALVQKHKVYSTRPNMVSRLNFLGYRSVNSAFYGPYWREVRKNLVTQVLNSSRVAAFKPFRELELKNLIDRVRDQAKKNGNVVPVLSNCRHTVFAILIHVCFGEAFSESQIQELDGILKRLLYLLKPQPEDFLPFIEIFTKKHKNECQSHVERLRERYEPYLEEHRKRRQRGTPTFDYIDSLLGLQEKVNLTERDMLGLISEVLAAGTDTTAATIQWSLAYLIQYPEMQARLYKEIKTVAGDRQVGEEDIEKLPYMQAVVKEALRIKPPLPLGLIHGLTESATLAGYDIPKETVVLFHYQAFQNDPERWDNPEKFIPERFLSAVPNPNHDMTGSHGPRSLDFVPFGAGRRICPGMELGLKHVHLILSRLIQAFQWSTVNPSQDVDFSDVAQFTLNMVTPLHARVKERSME